MVMVKIDRTKESISESSRGRDDGLRRVNDDEVSRFNAVFSKKRSSDKHKNSKEDENDEDISKNRGALGGSLSDVEVKNNNQNSDACAGVVPGDTILKNLHKSSEFHHSESISAYAAKTEAIQTIGGKIVERIIASNEALNAKQEVRIFLRDDILPQTEIRITKEGTDILEVDFYTRSDTSAAFLYANQVGLRDHLLNNLNNIRDVEIDIHRESADNEPGDGRSKQEYVGDYDDDNDKNKKASKKE